MVRYLGLLFEKQLANTPPPNMMVHGGAYKITSLNSVFCYSFEGFCDLIYKCRCSTFKYTTIASRYLFTIRDHLPILFCTILSLKLIWVLENAKT